MTLGIWPAWNVLVALCRVNDEASCALWVWFGSTGEMTYAGFVQFPMLLKIASLRTESVMGGGFGCNIS